MKLKTTMATLLLLCSGLSLAETAQEAAIKKSVISNFREGVKVDSVAKTPYAGLFEVRVGSEIFYTDEKGQYLFFGNIVEGRSGTDLTKQRTDELSKVKFSDLPLDLALKMVKGNGKRVFATFEDPNCGPCKQVRKNLQELNNVTVYTFMYNILAEDSADKSKNIWCSPDRNKAWDEWMLHAKAAPVAAQNCANPNEKVLELGKKLRVNATPTLIFTDGSRMPGAVDAKKIEEKLASIK